MLTSPHGGQCKVSSSHHHHINVQNTRGTQHLLHQSYVGSLGVVAYILKRQVTCTLLPHQSQPIYNGKKNRKIIPFAKGNNR